MLFYDFGKRRQAGAGHNLQLLQGREVREHHHLLHLEHLNLFGLQLPPEPPEILLKELPDGHLTLFVSLLILIHHQLPPILDGVFRAALQLLGDDGPLLADVQITAEEDEVFVVGPVALLYGWVEVAGPSLTALLGRTVFMGCVVFLEVKFLGDFKPTLLLIFTGLGHGRTGRAG